MGEGHPDAVGLAKNPLHRVGHKFKTEAPALEATGRRKTHDRAVKMDGKASYQISPEQSGKASTVLRGS